MNENGEAKIQGEAVAVLPAGGLTDGRDCVSTSRAPTWRRSRSGTAVAKAASSLRHCNACGEDHFYPRPFCPKCWSPDVEWKQATGHGTLYTYSIVVQNDLPPFNERVPYVAAVVELDEGPA